MLNRYISEKPKGRANKSKERAKKRVVRARSKKTEGKRRAVRHLWPTDNTSVGRADLLVLIMYIIYIHCIYILHIYRYKIYILCTCDVVVQNGSEMFELVIGQSTDDEDDAVEYDFPVFRVLFVQNHEQSFEYLM